MSAFDQMYRLAFNKFSSQPPKKVKLASYLKVARQLHDKPLHEAMAAKLDPAQIADSYLPYDVESYWVDWWRKEGFFHGQEERVNKGGKKPYTIVLPPPNVTGYLHIGHALTSSIQDALCRWRRMQGYEVCYLPGTDHAGIATQTVVEKELMKLQGKSKYDLGREEFLRRVWEWKDKHGAGIINQLKRMGSSLDWDREVFTMDPKLSKAVTEAFVRLNDQGLIYRSNRLVNWSCKLRTAIADIEVQYEDLPGPKMLEVPGHEGKYEFGVLVKFAYKVKDSEEEVVVATTRIETMLGDVAVAVNSKDPRYTHLIGRELIHPFDPTRTMRVIADDVLVDMNFGTGAVKITPAHDPNDYECGLRHKLQFISIFSDEGRINERGGAFNGLMRFDCRNQIQTKLGELGLLRGKEPNPMRLGFCQRSKDVVEPMIRPQWWINCQTIAQPMLDVVKDGSLNIVPKEQIASWNRWIGGLRDWCISRQLWWGHRIPAYQIELDGVLLNSQKNESWAIARSFEEAKALAETRFPGRKVGLRQDEDVLDTWFSSALFPFSVFGWPQETEQLRAFYPNSVLETGQDILFFWVARMVMMSLWLNKKLPFHTVFLHTIVSDEEGRKMSKSLGNVIDPLQIIDGTTVDRLVAKVESSLLPTKEKETSIKKLKLKFPEGIPECGSDALRFGLLAYMVQSSSINLNINTIVSNRQFCNKIWNTIKFGLMFIPPGQYHALPSLPRAFINRWIRNCLALASQAINQAFEKYDFGEITVLFRQFWLYELCDIYLEAIKPIFRSALDKELVHETASTLLFCLQSGLRLLHPLMPFLTQELYQKLPPFEGKQRTITLEPYPLLAEPFDRELARTFEQLSKVAGGYRSIGASFNVPNNIKAQGFIILGKQSEHLLPHLELISTLAKTSAIGLLKEESEVPRGCGSSVVEGCRLYLLIREFINLEKEEQRLLKKIAEQETFILNARRKTEVRDYESKVPEKVRRENAEAIEKFSREKQLLEETLRKIKEL